ncbi:hypothetical protein FRC12_003099 [Ceratobasidium sp. 428]|nr:hypothetical protein FRC12_003099 [Ceratobasidium sp. 428]
MSQPKTSKPTNSVPLSKTDSQSSDYFDDDPEFAEALATLDDHTLFGSQPLACLDNVSCDLGDISKPSSQGRKRRRSLSPAGQENSPKDSTGDILSVRLPNSGCDAVSPDNNPSIHFPTFDPGNSTTPKIDTYAASKFGEFGDYFRRKRAKLQNQNADINSQEKRSSQTTLFKSLSIFVRLAAVCPVDYC